MPAPRRPFRAGRVLARAVADAEGWSGPLRLAVARARRSAAQDADGTPRAGGDAPARERADAELPAWRTSSTRSTAACCGRRSPTACPSRPGGAADRGVGPQLHPARGLRRARGPGPSAPRRDRTGRAPDVAWSGRPGLALPEAGEDGMDDALDALDAAVADTPDTAPLRALLAGTPGGPARPRTRPLEP